MYRFRCTINSTVLIRKRNLIPRIIGQERTLKTESPEYTLYYHESRGVAEPSRLILSLKKVPFVDYRLPFVWPIVMPPELKAISEFGQLPILKVGDKVIGQSQTISRHLARTFDLTGKNEWEVTRCDELVDVARDLLDQWTLIFVTRDPTRKLEMTQKATEKTRNRYFSKFNEILLNKKKGAGPVYFVGDDLTWADIWVAHVADSIETSYKLDLVKDFPELKELIQTVFTTPGIKEWVEKRPKTKF